MKRQNLFFVSALFLMSALISIPCSAACLEIQTPKIEYLAGETFQAEITGIFMKPLSAENIAFFFGNKEYFPSFSLEQAASNKWILWTDLPSNYGTNALRITVLCSDNGLREVTKTVEFAIKKSIGSAYSKLIFQTDNKWNQLNSDEISLSLFALSYDDRLRENGKTALLAKKNPTQSCWPSACKVTSTALAMLALNKSGENVEGIQNWLIDAENSIEPGLWELILESDSSKTCALKINNNLETLALLQGTNSFSIASLFPDEEKINISLNCSLTSAKLSHTYLGKVHDFAFVLKENIFSYTLNNEKCWGQGYREECTPLSTAYAIWLLQNGNSLQKEIEWLSANAETTEEKAFAYLFTKDSELEQWLLNNQATEGFWSAKSLALSQTPDISATVAALRAISGTEMSKAKGDNWLRAQLAALNVKETALALQIFTPDKIEPIISFPGFVKGNSAQNITLLFSNKGHLPVNLSISFFDKTQIISIQPASFHEFILSLPEKETLTFAYIEMLSSTYLGMKKSYKIPALIFPSAVKEEQIEAIINETEAVSLIPADFLFSPPELNASLPKNQLIEINLTLRNLSPELKKISITISGLFDIIEKIEPSSFDLGPNETALIKVIFNTEKAFGVYSGVISAESEAITVDLPVYLSIEEAKTCSELGGQFCSAQQACSQALVQASDGDCCLGICEEIKPKIKLDKKFIGIAMIALAALLIAAFFFFRLRKKEKPALKVALEKVGRQELRT